MQSILDFPDVINNDFQRSALLAQRLGFFRIVPDFRIGEFAFDFYQPVSLVVVVKDTS